MERGSGPEEVENNTVGDKIVDHKSGVIWIRKKTDFEKFVDGDVTKFDMNWLQKWLPECMLKLNENKPVSDKEVELVW